MREARVPQTPAWVAPAWVAPAAVVVVAGASFAAYQTAPPAVANAVAIVYAASLVLGPACVYPWTRRRGAAPAVAAALSLAVPLLWLGKECWAVGGVFGPAEALYYAANPLALGLIVGAGLQMALAELLLRRADSGRWQLANGAGLVLAAIALLAGAYGVAAARYDPTVIFWAYIALYRRLFG
jgi:hypothetical protein